MYRGNISCLNGFDSTAKFIVDNQVYCQVLTQFSIVLEQDLDLSKLKRIYIARLKRTEIFLCWVI